MIKNLKILLYELKKNPNIITNENREQIIFSLETTIEILEKLIKRRHENE